jgi:hypothetical protein
VGEASKDALVLARRYTASLQEYVQRGGRLLLLADPDGAGEGEPAIRLPVGAIVPREGTAWQGDWATSFAWVRKQGPLAQLPGEPLLEMESVAIMPDWVIAGIPNFILREHSWAGLSVGWVHKVVSLLIEMPYGRGHVTATTFKLNAATLASDAMAQALFSGIVQLS